jgi:membrane protease YdiL (CAAX protease family)
MKSYLRMIGLFVLLVAIHQGLAFLYLVPIATYYTLLGIEGEALEQLLYAQSVNATIFSGLGSLLVYLIIFNSRKENLFVRSRFHKISLKQAGWSAAIGASFVFLSLLIVHVMSIMFPVQYVNFIEMMDVFVDAPFIVIILAVVIVAPLFEEIMFRGIVFDSLSKRMNVYISIVIAGLFFGIYHMNIFQGTYATLIGIVMGFSLVWTKSIWAPMIIHFVNNLVSVLLSYSAIGAWLDTEGALPIILSILIAITILPFSIYKLYQTYEKPVPEEPQIELELDAIV